jgi:hypothetical protein
VLEAENGAAGNKSARGIYPHPATLDLNIPMMNEYEAARACELQCRKFPC